MIESVVVRTQILAFILMYFTVGFAVAQTKVVVVPLGTDAGISGYERVTENLSDVGVAPGHSIRTSIACPNGKLILSAGLNPNGSRWVITNTFPNDSGGWTFVAKNSSSFTLNFRGTIFGLCASSV